LVDLLAHAVHVKPVVEFARMQDLQELLRPSNGEGGHERGSAVFDCLAHVSQKIALQVAARRVLAHAVSALDYQIIHFVLGRPCGVVHARFRQVEVAGVKQALVAGFDERHGAARNVPRVKKTQTRAVVKLVILAVAQAGSLLVHAAAVVARERERLLAVQRDFLGVVQQQVDQRFRGVSAKSEGVGVAVNRGRAPAVVQVRVGYHERVALVLVELRDFVVVVNLHACV